MTEETYERTYYDFDNASIENGYVDITSSKVLCVFPEITRDLSTVPKEINLYLDKILTLSFKWLPFFSYNDYVKIHDIFYKCMYSFEPTYIPYTNSPYQAYNKRITNVNVKHYTIYTLEEMSKTSIQISKNETCPSEPIVLDSIFQIYIGHNLNFCTQRDLPGLNREETIYIVQLILKKFTE
jgi:hypothetical protein